MRDLMRVQGSIVASIAEGLRLRLSGEEKAQLGGFGTNDPAAYEMVLKGRFLMQSEREEDEMAARKLFLQAIATDPNFADAYLALASSYERAAGEGFEPPRDMQVLALEALRKAASIDPENPAVRVALAHQRFRDTSTRDWAALEREYRAVMNEPALLRTTQYHPIALFFVAIGRPDEAVTLVERALVVDPGNLESRVMLGTFLFQAGRLDEALQVYNTIAAEVPDDPRPLFGAADVYKRRGDFARASEVRRKAYETSSPATTTRPACFSTRRPKRTMRKQKWPWRRRNLKSSRNWPGSDSCSHSTLPAFTRRSAIVSRPWLGSSGSPMAATSAWPCSRWTRPGIQCELTPGLRPLFARSAFPDARNLTGGVFVSYGKLRTVEEAL
jgi:Tfp pilus assembly protein PilF